MFQGRLTGRCKPKKKRLLARDGGFVEGVRFSDLYQGWGRFILEGGGRSPTPHGTHPGIVKGGKAGGGRGGRIGRRKPWGMSPGAKVCMKERSCSSSYWSTRDRTSLLLEESSQSLGCSIPLPGISNTEAHTLLRAYICTWSMPRSLERSYEGRRSYSRYMQPCTFQIQLSSGRAP